MTSDLKDCKARHYGKLRSVHGQMHHLCLKNRLCACKNNAATTIMARNFLLFKNIQEMIPCKSSRAIAVGHSYSDPVRVAAMLAQTMPWDEIIIVGDRQGPLYDRLRTVKTPSELPKIESFDQKKRTLVIFDECFTPSRVKADMMIMEDFAIRSRLYGVFTLFVECALDYVPLTVRKNTDVLYLTTRPRPRCWKAIHQLINIRVPAADCFAGAGQNHWLKIDKRNDETEVIDASKYYP